MGLKPGNKAAIIEGEELLLGGDIVLDVLGISLAEGGARSRIKTEIKRRQEQGQLIKVTVLRAGKRVEPQTVLP